ncbi:MAG: efflux RND transporter permease subunit, partial [Inhella sp.]
MFDFLVHSSLRNRLMVLAFALAMMLLGAITLTRTPVDVFPSLDRPQVTLQIEAGGMAPE